MSDQNLKFILSVTYGGGELKQFNVDLAGVVDKAKGAESALVKTGNGFVSLSGASKNAVSALDGLGISTVALTDPMYAAGAAVKYAIDQAAESQKVMAQTEAAIKSTGGAAGLSAEEIANMAQSLSYTSTFADDAIQKGENLLLTFTNIGGDVFPEATQAMLDMSTAMGTDASSGAIQLGKALNDPVAGISALSRVGVTFTDDQKKVIKSLVETGDVAGAQKIILAELNKEFGGSAAAAADTYAGRMSRLQNAIDDLAESAATAPIAGRGLLDWLADAAEGATTLLTMTQRINAALADHADEVQDTAGNYEDYATELKRAADAAGYSVNAQGDLTRMVITTAGAYEEVIQQGYLLGQSEYDAAKAADAVAEAQDGAAKAAEAVSKAQDEAAEAAQDLAAANEEAAAKAEAQAKSMLLQAALSGKLAGIDNNYAKTLADTNDELEDVQAELDQYISTQGQAVYSTLELEQLHQKLTEAQAKEADAGNELWQVQQNLNNNTDPEKQAQLADAVARAQLAYDGAVLSTQGAAQAYRDAGAAAVDNSAKIQELTQKHDDLIKKQEEAEEAAKKQTNQFIFDQAAVSLDAEAQLDLANSLGLIDEKSYNAAKAVYDLREQFDNNHDGSITAAEGAGKYADAVVALAGNMSSLRDRAVEGADAVAGLSDRINNLQDRTVTVRYVQGELEYNGKRAGGGPVESGGVYQVNETPGVGPEYFIPSSNGYMLNQSQAQAAMAGGVSPSSGGSMNSVSIGSVNINNGMDQAIFEAMMRRAFFGG